LPGPQTTKSIADPIKAAQDIWKEMYTLKITKDSYVYVLDRNSVIWKIENGEPIKVLAK